MAFVRQFADDPRYPEKSRSARKICDALDASAHRDVIPKIHSLFISAPHTTLKLRPRGWS